MAKKLTDSQQAAYACIKKNFRKGEVLSYETIGAIIGMSREGARQAVLGLGGKVKRKNGHIVGVK